MESKEKRRRTKQEIKENEPVFQKMVKTEDKAWNSC